VGSIYQVIEILSKEKGIDCQIVVDAVKDAMLVAARKQFKTTEDLVADFDPRGGIHIYGVRKVVEEVQDPIREISLLDAQKLDPGAEMDGEIRIPKPTETLGRISAQTAKQVILQKVREAERETIHSEYSGRVGELVNCTVKRIEGQDLIVDLGKTEARLPKKEQSRLENFSVGDRVRCVIKSVEKAGKNAGVIVSRGAPELVMRLFEQEVPEIYDNTVVIKACAREAGERTKIAVSSRDRDVDSVGACVGMKGMRVQSIIRELRGEKIDIIEYSEEPVVFATHALSPAKISRVSILDPLGRHMEVIVDDTQLSLAIGKKGQNVRLAAKLLAWKIDIKSEEEKRQEVEAHMATLVVPGAPVSVLLDHGLSEQVVERLVESGVGTVEKLGSMTPEDLEAIPEIGPELVGAIQMAVNSYYGQFETAAPAGQDEEVVLEEWNTEAPPPAAPVEAAPVADDGALPVLAPSDVAPSDVPGMPAEQAEGSDDPEFIPEGETEDPGISGLSHGDSTLQDLDENEAADPGVGAVEGEADNR
jgi:transcription termination/antitermination protein NusA